VSEPKANGVIDGCTIAEALERLEAAGHTGHFAARDTGMVLCLSCRQESPAGEVELVQVARTEGVSDPDDETAIAALVCPRCGTRGTLVLKYGPEAPLDDAEVLRLLWDRRDPRRETQA
jgi:hypothetical protein